MRSCCRHSKTAKRCRRKDKKVFSLPRRFTRKRCIRGDVNGYTMRSSCAPYIYCKIGGSPKANQSFLYNPENPNTSFDVYIDKNPKDTIEIKYKTVDDIKDTISKLERLYKQNKYTHKRIWQVGMIMKVRLEAMLKHKKTLYTKAKHVRERFSLVNKYFKFLSNRTKAGSNERKQMKFSF